MAVQAVVAHRLMFPQHRPALVGMAVVARFVDGEFLQQLIPDRRTVRIVAVAAYDFALPHRMMRILERVGTLAGVAGKALLGLGEFHQDRIFRDVDGVAVVTRHIVRFVRAALPVHPHARLVAGQALFDT